MFLPLLWSLSTVNHDFFLFAYFLEQIITPLKTVHAWGLCCYPRRAWAATGIVVCWFVCLCILNLLTGYHMQHCVYSMDSLHTTSYYFNSDRF